MARSGNRLQGRPLQKMSDPALMCSLRCSPLASNYGASAFSYVVTLCRARAHLCTEETLSPFCLCHVLFFFFFFFVERR